MDWIEVKVHTTTAGADLVSEQLMQEGATGTMVEDRADVPDPDKPPGFWEMIDPDLIQHMPEDVVVHAWFEPDHRYADRMQALRDRLEQWQRMELGMDLGSLDVETQDVKEEDWAEVWKRFYKPFHAGRPWWSSLPGRAIRRRRGTESLRLTPAWPLVREPMRPHPDAWASWRII